jgi:hypothetical protein
MGRGRAKAKQTKVARELKYSSHGTDLDALRAELSGTRTSDGHAANDHGDGGEDAAEDPYAQYADDED